MMLQSSLFQQTEPRELLPYGGSALYYPRIFDSSEAASFFHELATTTPWKQEYVQFYGKRHPIPRETAWFGDSGATYTYSKIPNSPLPWTPVLSQIKQRVEMLANVVFNSVLLNRYRNGNDSVAWHADDEPELGPQPTIASVSLGASRTFQMKSCENDADRVSIVLEDGSVLIMSGDSQRAWKHQVPKERSETAQRINLTFRVIGEKQHTPGTNRLHRH